MLHASMEDLTEQERYIADAPEVARRLAQAHVNVASNQLKLLSEDPNNARAYPGQDPMCFYVEGEPQSVEDVDGVAGLIKPQFFEIQDMLAAQQNTSATISSISNSLESGSNVAIVTSHEDITDIAFALKLVGNFLVDPKDPPPDSAIVVSKMIAEIGYDLGHDDPVVGIRALQLLCKDIFLSWPRTESAKSEINRLPPNEVSRHNRQMAEKLTEDLDKGGRLLAVAPTGTTRVSFDEAGEYKLNPLRDGTIEIMKHPLTQVLPMIVQFKEGAPAVAMHDELISVTNSEEANNVRRLLAKMHTEQAQKTGVLPRQRNLGRTALQN